MSRLPAVFEGGRGIQISLVASAAIGQGLAATAMAFATRDVFVALRGLEMASTVAKFPTADVAIIVLGGMVLAGMRFLERVLAERLGQDYAAAVRKRLFVHMSRTPASVLASYRTGTLSLRFVGDLSAIKGWMSSGLARLISAFVTIPASVLILFALDPLLGLAGIPPILLALVLIGLFSRPLERAHARLRNRRNRMAADIAERLPQSAALRNIGRMKQEQRTLTYHSDQVAEAAVGRVRAAGFLRAVPDVTAAVASASLLTVASQYGLSAADAAASLTVLALIVRPMRQLAGVWDRRQAWNVAATNLERVLSTRRLPRGDTKNGPTEQDGCLALEFRGVEMPSTVTLDASIKAAEWVRLAGPGNTGSNSLLLVAAGLELPVHGDVVVLGRSPWSVPAGEILYLGPLSPILKGSLRRNAVMGAPRIPDDETVVAALNKAGLGGLVERLGGLDGRVNEAARNLSGVELSQLLCVRALLVRPKLLLVDAVEIGLAPDLLNLLHDELRPTECAALIASGLTYTAEIYDRTLLCERQMLPDQTAYEDT